MAKKRGNQTGGAILAVVLAVIALVIYWMYKRGGGDLIEGFEDITGIDLQSVEDTIPDWWTNVEWYANQETRAVELAAASAARSEVLQQSGVNQYSGGNPYQASGRYENITSASVLAFEGWSTNIVELEPGYYEVRIGYNGTEANTAETHSYVTLEPSLCKHAYSTPTSERLCEKTNRLFAEYKRRIASGQIVPVKA